MAASIALVELIRCAYVAVVVEECVCCGCPDFGTENAGRVGFSDSAIAVCSFSASLVMCERCRERFANGARCSYRGKLRSSLGDNCCDVDGVRSKERIGEPGGGTDGQHSDE